MKGKIFVILLLMGLLVFTVFKMMEYEQSIREERVITHYIEDDSKPLLVNLDKEHLQDIVNDMDIEFKAGIDYFLKKNIDKDDNVQWNTIMIKGVNLGVAVPGKFPAEFSLGFDQYLAWLIKIGEMNANVIRLYTILPPDFYKAFAYYNLHFQNKPLYLIQGVWATDPESKDYLNPVYTRKFQKEIIDVIDVLNGNAVLKKQPGKADGVYSVDISRYVMAILLGREWEPKTVYQTIKKNNRTHFTGDFISIANANAMEVWLAMMMDFTVRYETQNYHRQHPVSFVNWLPLDNIYHSTEYIENKKVREYDNDLKSIDFNKFNSSHLFKAGIYAAYHVYPYYPDFINIDSLYANAKNMAGQTDNFYGYLLDLKNHNEGLPLVIAEYGLPTSRGISHYSYTGFHQGGHSEYMQAQKSLILTKDIFDTRCAGAIYFEWTDEWFKHNWLVQDFEIPFKNRKLWHNMENPEQNFGIVALEDKKHIIDADFEDWHNGDSYDIIPDADATYFYIRANLPGFDFEKNNLYIAIDTYDKEKGDHKLPFSNKKYDNGFEFLCVFKSQNDAKILVDDKYSVYTDIYNDSIPVYCSKPNDNGKYIDQYMLINRGRETLLGVKTDSIVNNRSPLVFGNSSKSATSNCDWNFSKQNHTLELRLDWHLLNVSDPSHLYVLDDIASTKEIEASQTRGFNFYLFITDKNNNISYQYPVDKPYFFTWNKWDKPTFSQRTKPLYDTLKAYFKNLPAAKEKTVFVDREDFSIANFRGDKKAAISISFDNNGFSQYQIAFPILNKYEIKATYGILPGILDVNPSYSLYNEGQKIKRTGIVQLKEILNYDNEIALQADDSKINTGNMQLLRIFPSVNTLHTRKTITGISKPENILFVKYFSPKKISSYVYDNVRYNIVNTGINEMTLDSILKKSSEQWTILQYFHIIKDSVSIKNDNGFFIEKNKFHKQIRLARNTDYWLATESAVFKYLKEKQNAKIEIKRHKNLIYLNINSKLDFNKYNHPLTIKYKTNAKIIKISGSATDGYYTNRTGTILFDIIPGKETVIEIIK